MLNIYIVYGKTLWLNIEGADFELRNSLFEDVKLTKNSDLDMYKYSS